MLFITHDLSVVSYLADRIAVMNRGRIVEIGDSLDVLDQPRDSYTRELLASSTR
ncbi:ABC-type dipeptide/oligopeptide/nickel transport system ATPase component [Rhizobium sp. BE258]|nr:ABC-type dipeptide/oligopeptide/nickel transport system ATPase component [Rhizobium sp. BE258]